MAQRQRIHRGLQGLVLLGLVCLLISCDDAGGRGCGGTEATVSCLEVDNIAPQDSANNASSNVDAFQDICTDDEGNPTEPEPFTDHSAVVTFSNTTFPGADDSFAIRIVRFSVSYRLNDCPTVASECPALTGFSAGQSLVIPAGSTVTGTFPFVPLRVKAQYNNAGGSEFPPPSYTAVYTFTAQTTPVNETITVEASTEFSIGNFNLCP